MQIGPIRRIGLALDRIAGSFAKLEEVIPLLFIALSALAMANIHKGYLYSMWDSPVPALSPELLLGKAHYIWDWWFVGGRAYSHAFYFPYFLAVWLLNLVFPVGIANTAVYYMLFAFSGISMYLFTSNASFEGGANLKRNTALLASLAYMFNTYWIFRVAAGVSLSYIMAFLPLLLLLLKRSLCSRTKLEAARYLLASSLVTVAMSPGFGPHLVFAFFLAIEYLFFFSLLERKLRPFVFTVALFAMCMFSANLWWITPQLFGRYFLPAITRGSEYVEESLQIMRGHASYTTPLNALRAMPYDVPTLHYSMPWTMLYETPLFLSISILVPAISALPLISKRTRKDPETIVFALMWITTLPVIIGMNPPTEPLFLWAHRHLPFMVLRRPPIFVFGLHLVYSYLFSLGVASLYNFLENLTSQSSQSLSKPRSFRFSFKVKKSVNSVILIAIIVSVIVMYPFPLWLGLDYRIELRGRPVSALTTIPIYVHNLVDYLNAQPDDYGVLVLPLASNLNAYAWDRGYFGWSPYYLMLDRPVLSFEPNGHPMSELYESLASFKFYLPNDLEETNPTVIYDGDARFWTLRRDGVGSYDGTLAQETSIEQNGTRSLKIAIASGSYSELYVDHSYDTPKNFSDYDFISWWWYGQNTGTIIRFTFRSGGSFDSRSQYQFTDNFNGWKRFAVPLLRFQQEALNPVNWSAVDYIRIVVIPKQTTSLSLGRIVADVAKSSFKTKKFAEILALARMKYVILTNDALPTPGQRYSFDLSVYQSFLSKQENLELVGAFGPHLLYRNLEETKVFYTPSFVIKSNMSDASSHLMRLTEFQDPFKAAISEDITLEFRPPRVTVKRLNPVAYEIDVLNASSTYLLVSPFIYDKNWVAIVDSLKVRPIKVNGLFSGWLIDKPGRYVVTIYYILQDYAETAHLVSYVVILISSLMVVLPSKRIEKTIRGILQIIGRSSGSGGSSAGSTI